MSDRTAPIAVLFVGLDNTCRSVVAEAVARAEATRRGLDTLAFDSAGTSWRHAGLGPASAVLTVGSARNYSIDRIARRVHADDLARYDLLVAMDMQTMHDLERVRAGMELRRTFHLLLEPQQVQLLRRWDPYAMPGDEDLAPLTVIDVAQVERVFDVVERTVPPLIDHLVDLVAAAS
jgi:protein-tyrosine-phosphatase